LGNLIGVFAGEFTVLSARAYSLTMKSRLAISLSWIGGYTNVIALMSLGTVVSHVSGTATNIGLNIGRGNFRQVIFFASILLTFLLGATVSALMTETARRNGWRSKYTLPIALEAVLLAIVASYLPRQGSISQTHIALLAGVASFAMGLQNATITKISGAIVRTTHLTGIFTDLGIESIQYLFWYKDRLAQRQWERAGRLLRISSRHPSAQRLLLLASIAGSFGFGAVLGSLAYSHWSAPALYVPVAFLAAIILIDARTPIADIRDVDIDNDDELKLRNLASQLLPREISLYRFACARGSVSHRAPNFQLWLNRVPDHCRVAILAISPLTRFDANAVLDLEAAVGSLHTRGQKLVISGITTAQFKALHAHGVASIMDINNLCTDLEFAIARAMAILAGNHQAKRAGEPLAA
jgi:uncharacterized membrane protein YoaK (UPF0700 family)